MSQDTLRRHSIPHAPLAVLAFAVFAAACDSHVHLPTAPDWQNFPSGAVGIRSLEIHASLTAEQGSCFEATLLYDGEELPGARSTCPRSGGCRLLRLEGTTSSDRGRHTISIRVLSQSADEVSYMAEGFVWVTRENLSLPRLEITLNPSHVRLRPGESADFDLEFSD